MAEQIYVDPNKIVFIQSRVATQADLIHEYAEMMRAGIEFDAADGIRTESGAVYIYDGLHRGEAAKIAGMRLRVAVRPGNKQDAEWLALTANQKHGLRRTREDKQRIVCTALLHPYGANLSNRAIARHCGLDHKTVGKIRQGLELSGEIPQINKRTITRGGVTYQQDTTQIGQRSPGSVKAGHTLPACVKPETPEPNGNQLLERIKQFGRAWEPSVKLTAGEPTQPEPRAQEFECPRCGQEKIVGVNGSRRWCLNCGAEWPTAVALLEEVEARPVRDEGQTRQRLQSRFERLLAGVQDEQLGEIEPWLDELERHLTSRPHRPAYAASSPVKLPVAMATDAMYHH